MGRIVLILVVQFIYSFSMAIVGGSPVEQSHLIASSTVSLNKAGRSFCTGTLITERHVVTAAHCIGADLNFKIGFGLSEKSLIHVDIKSIVVHPEFSRRQFTNSPDLPPHDIALIELKESAPINFNPVSIAEDSVKSNDLLILAGFGLTQFFNGTSGILRFVETKVQTKFSSTLEFLFGFTPGKSACKGDSGGPAYTFNGEQLYLSGVTSRGVSGKVDSLGRPIGCSGEGFYTDVLDHKDWITKNLQ